MASNSRIRSVLIGPADESFSSAYFFQYASLMFILLTFVIGSFRLQDAVQRGEAEAAPSAAVPNTMPVAGSAPIGSLSYDRLFDSDGTLLGEPADALAEFLVSHDVDAEITLFGGRSDGEFALGVGRAAVLGRFLVGRGVPIHGFSVTVSPEASPVQAAVKVFKEG